MSMVITTVEAVLNSPDEMKVCKNCGKLNHVNNSSCVNCWNMQFETDKEYVAKKLDELNSSCELDEECPI